MIPRELLKKIRQIEIRTNRSVSGSAAGARASARFTVRKPNASETSPAPNGIRPLKRRERRAPITAGSQMVVSPALTCVLSPGRGFQPVTVSASPAARPANPVVDISISAARVSPSPWGEGRDEGGCETNFTLHITHFTRSAFRAPHSALI
jgi:hypothetical protein